MSPPRLFTVPRASCDMRFAELTLLTLRSSREIRERFEKRRRSPVSPAGEGPEVRVQAAGSAK